MCTSGIIRTFVIHTVWQMQTSYARGHRVYRKFGLCVFKMTKWSGIPRIVTASMNIAGIAKFIVALI